MTPKVPIQYIQFYTDGSAAKKLETAAPKKNLPELKPNEYLIKRRERTVRIDPVAVLGLVVAVCMFLTLAVGMLQLRDAVEERRAMEQYVNYLHNENIRYQEDYAASYDLAEIEKSALSMGMIPAKEATVTTIHITPVTQPQQQESFFQSVGTFLTGLFA